MVQCGGHGTVVVVGGGGELTPLVYETRSLPKVRREAVRGQYLYGSGVVSFTDEQASFRVEVTVRTKTISGAAGTAPQAVHPGSGAIPRAVFQPAHATGDEAAQDSKSLGVGKR